MIRRTDRLLLQVRVSFETTRFGRQHLIDAYARLIPTVRRMSLRSKRSEAQPRKAKVAAMAARGGDK